ncbi:MAG: NTP transferase domain-containing protein, partial [Candidatus Dormibacteraeota bacterium]|nr:NTP transferase domain-containing protein [Candidatus Dormibacteraeota bacterium]
MSGSPETVWAVVLIKDFGSAKERLSAALPSGERRELARRNAKLALAAAGAASHVLAVCGGLEAAELARLAGVEVLLEAQPAGQNPAARLGIDFARQRGAGAVLLLSSDLPLIRPDDIAELLARARTLG